MTDSILSLCGRLTLCFALCCLSFLAPSCGGNETSLDIPAADINPLAAHDAVNLPQLTGDPLGSLPGLPVGDPLAEANRNLSFTNIVSYNGNAIFDSSPGTLFPNNSVVIPSGLNGTTWVRYAFNTGGYQPKRVSVDLTCNAGSVAYIAYSNYQTGRWDWQPPASGLVSYNLQPALYLNGSDQFYVAVLTAGGSTATVNSLSVRFDNDLLYDFSISGTLLDEHGAPLASQFVSITPNPDFVNVITDVDGSYIIGLPTTGMYQVQPLSLIMGFTPLNEMIDVQGHETGVDFSGMRVDIRGRIANTDDIGLAGVSLILSPGGSTTISGADGEYEFQGVANGAYTVDPMLATYSFDPASANANVAGSDVEDVNFDYTGGQPTYSILGNISEAGSSPVPDVVVVLNPGYRLAFTDNNGNYSFTGLPAGSYDLDPVKGNWSFSPAVRQVTIDSSSVNNTDFTASPPPPEYMATGTVRWKDSATQLTYGVPGITIEAIDCNTNEVRAWGATDENGFYSISGLVPGCYDLKLKSFVYASFIFWTLDITDHSLDNNDFDVAFKSGGPTWNNFAASYVANSCSSCHRPESQTSVSPNLREYGETKAAGTASNARIQNGTMPPGNPSSELNKVLFKRWREADYPLE
jgi:hypothetical protein